MRNHRDTKTLRLSLCLCVFVVSGAAAEDRIDIGTLGVLSTTRKVEVVVSADTDTPLTGLNIDVRFDPALCPRIVSQRTELADRVTANDVPIPLDADEALGCPDDGRLSLVLADLALRNAPAVVPAGRGEIARWVVELSQVPSDLNVPLTAQVKQARNGVQEVALQLGDGRLAATCVGDCAGDRTVAINELILGVGIALEAQPIDGCPAFDPDGNGAVAINELIGAVNNALRTCTAV